MPHTATIQSEIQKINDKVFAGFEGFPADAIEVADRWAEVVNVSGKDVVPSSTTAAAAREAFRVLMLGATTPGAGLLIFPLAFTAYAVALAPGMATAFTGTPPPIPIDFTSVYAIGNAGGSGEDCAIAMAAVIHAWFLTGTAVNTSVGGTVNWVI